MKLITTSWDDGHQLDFKLADLLVKYNVKGTFYIPKKNAERPVMPPSKIKQLAKDFEIGGHTLNHVRLNKANKGSIDNEIRGSYQWLAELLGKNPVSFCFPGGAYNHQSVEAVFRHGYKLARTTELHTTELMHKNKVCSTTLQLYAHSSNTHIKHLVKRRRFVSLARWLKSGVGADLTKLTEFYLRQIETAGGCFHLWGHSWEIEENNLWQKLEEILKVLTCRPEFNYVENHQLLDTAAL